MTRHEYVTLDKMYLKLRKLADSPTINGIDSGRLEDAYMSIKEVMNLNSK